MATTLMFAQTIFYLTASIAIIMLGGLCANITCRLMRVTRELEKLSRSLNHASVEAGERMRDVVDRLSNLPILSYFLKRHTEHEEKDHTQKAG